MTRTLKLRRVAWGLYSASAHGADWRVERRRGMKDTEPRWVLSRDGIVVESHLPTLGAARTKIAEGK